MLTNNKKETSKIGQFDQIGSCRSNIKEEDSERRTTENKVTFDQIRFSYWLRKRYERGGKRISRG